MTTTTNDSLKNLRLWVGVHALRTVPPSRLNRGEDGSPKTAHLGGVDRLRWSSQAQKRHWRMAFPALLRDDADRLGVRTRELPTMVRAALAEAGVRADVADGMTELLQTFGRAESTASNGEGTGQTATLLFLSHDEIQAALDFAKKHADALVLVAPPLVTTASPEGAAPAKGRKKAPKAEGAFDRDAEIAKLRKQYTAFLEERGARTAVDVAMFGRFLPTEEIPSVDACVQVAHAIGTGRHVLDYDYFTAVDDRAQGAKAGHLGELDLAAGTLYQHVVIDVASLARALGDPALARRGVGALLGAIALVTPTGGANGTAPTTPADYLDVEVRTQPPLNAAPAFDRPIRPTADAGVLDLSIAALRDRLARVAAAYDAPSTTRLRTHLTLRAETPADALAKGERPAHSLDALLAHVDLALALALDPTRTPAETP